MVEGWEAKREGGNSEIFNSKKILPAVGWRDEGRGRIEGRKGYRIPGARGTE